MEQYTCNIVFSYACEGDLCYGVARSSDLQVALCESAVATRTAVAPQISLLFL
jgi:hypothetical protein